MHKAPIACRSIQKKKNGGGILFSFAEADILRRKVAWVLERPQYWFEHMVRFLDN